MLQAANSYIQMAIYFWCLQCLSLYTENEFRMCIAKCIHTRSQESVNHYTHISCIDVGYFSISEYVYTCYEHSSQWLYTCMHHVVWFESQQLLPDFSLLFNLVAHLFITEVVTMY